jgi:hypothetical protein
MRRTLALLCLVAAACGGETTEPDPITNDRLEGAPGDPAVAAIERERYEPHPADFSTNHPAWPGVRVSHRVAIVGVGAPATVGEVNELLAELHAELVGGIPGAVNQAAGLLAIRLPGTTTHDGMEAALSTIRARPYIESATQDMELVTAEIPGRNAGNPAAWVWDEAGTSGSWGLAAIRAPQLWNLNASVRAANAAPIPTGVLDNGFSEGHEDLRIVQYIGPHLVRSHGTHVSGTIGAGFDNGKGIDGVTPFAALVVHVSGSLMSSVGATLWGLDALIIGQPAVRVVNVSLQYPWHLASPIVDVRSDAASQLKAHTDGELAMLGMAALQAAGYALPVVVAAAGNHGTVLPGLDARYGSPLASAGLVHGAAPIVVVESDALVPGLAASFTRSGFSNVNGHLSAPGSDIWSSDSGATARYTAMSGTSMAAPHVTGLVSYLYAMAPDLPSPTMLVNPVRDLLLANLQPGDRNGRPQIDAFAAALDIDRVRGGDDILRGLVDVDDGTRDGNLRADAAGAMVTNDDLAADGREIDMADFRRWRDWLLQVENAPGLMLDGAPDHPKKDPNGDGVPGEGPEYLHARGDFNGDGRLDRGGTRGVPGALGGQPVTDLQVLQHLFQDADYAAADLPGLITSGDVHLDPMLCLELNGAAQVITTARFSDGGILFGEPRLHAADGSAEILTLPAPSAYRLTVETLDAAGDRIGQAELETELAPGEDVHLRPECAPADGGSPMIRILELIGGGSSESSAGPGDGCTDVENIAANPSPPNSGAFSLPCTDAVGPVSVSSNGAASYTLVSGADGVSAITISSSSANSATFGPSADPPGGGYGRSSAGFQIDFEIPEEASVSLTGEAIAGVTGSGGGGTSEFDVRLARLDGATVFEAYVRVTEDDPPGSSVPIAATLLLEGRYRLQVSAGGQALVNDPGDAHAANSSASLTLTVNP